MTTTITIREPQYGVTVEEKVTVIEITNASVVAPQNVFIQDTLPVYNGPFVWFQTGLPNNGFTIWFDDGETV